MTPTPNNPPEKCSCAVCCSWTGRTHACPDCGRDKGCPKGAHHIFACAFAPAPEKCRCRLCVTSSANPFEFTGFIACEICGNKRCLHADDHTQPCTGSNDPADNILPTPHNQTKTMKTAKNPLTTPTSAPTQAIDYVNAPPHYNQSGIETIDAIQAALTPEEFRGFCKGNALKYVWRERHKGGPQDLEKAAWYIERLVRADRGA